MDVVLSYSKNVYLHNYIIHIGCAPLFQPENASRNQKKTTSEVCNLVLLCSGVLTWYHSLYDSISYGLITLFACQRAQ